MSFNQLKALIAVPKMGSVGEGRVVSNCQEWHHHGMHGLAHVGTLSIFPLVEGMIQQTHSSCPSHSPLILIQSGAQGLLTSAFCCRVPVFCMLKTKETFCAFLPLAHSYPILFGVLLFPPPCTPRSLQGISRILSNHCFCSFGFVCCFVQKITPGKQALRPFLLLSRSSHFRAAVKWRSAEWQCEIWD